MAIGIDPKVDFAFKLVFGSPDHTRITIHFLNAVMQLERPITWVEILNPIQGKDRSEEKLVVLDVLAKDRDGRRYNIEMQTTLPTSLGQRLTYYNCLNYVRQLGEGEPYRVLRPAVSICVLDRVLFQQADEFHLSFRLRCDQRDLVFSDNLIFHMLELPKFRPVSDNIGNLNPLEKWLYFLRHAEHLDATELCTRLVDAEFEEATGVLKMISQSPEDRQFYEARLKFLHDEQARLIAARAEGHAEGVERGQLAGKIQVLQELLGDPVTSVSDLLASPPETLSQQFATLQERLRSSDGA